MLCNIPPNKLLTMYFCIAKHIFPKCMVRNWQMSFFRFSFLLQTDLHCCPRTQRFIFCSKFSFRFKFFFIIFRCIEWADVWVGLIWNERAACLWLFFLLTNNHSFKYYMIMPAAIIFSPSDIWKSNTIKWRVISNRVRYVLAGECSRSFTRRILWETVYCWAIKFTLHRRSFKVIQRWWRRRRRNATT